MSGKVYLKSRNGERWIRTSAEDAQKLVDSGEMLPSSEAEYRDNFNRRQQAGVVGGAAALAEGVGAGAVDAALAIPKLATAGAEAVGAIDADPLADITGRSTLSGARFLASEIAGGEGPVAEREYDEQARIRAEENPLASGAGYVAGSIAGSGMPVGAGIGAARGAVAAGASRTLGRAAGFALEGAAQGTGAAAEEAWIQDSELTAEQLWGSVGLGAVLGGGIGIAPVFATKGMGKLKRVFGRADDVAPSTAAKTMPSAESIDEAVGEVFKREGVAPAPGLGKHIREMIEEAQAVASGADAEGKAIIKKAGPLRWDEPAMKARDLYSNRDNIINDAARDIAKAVDSMATEADDVIQTVVDSRLRREHIRRMIVPDGPMTPSMVAKLKEQEALQLAEVRGQFAKIQRVIDDTAPYAPAKDASIEELAAYQAANELLGNSRARKQTADYIYTLIAQLDEVDGAGAFDLLDEAKRTLQKEHVALSEAAKGASRSGNRGGQLGTQKLADYYESVQEPSRLMLENERIWGRLGKWQREKNEAFKRYMDTNKVFSEAWLRKVQDRDYYSRPVFRADPGKILSRLDKLGTATNELDEEFVKRHIVAAQDLIEAIATGTDEFAPQLATARKQIEAVDKLAAKADETVRASNQIHRLIEGESRGMGGMIGGAAWGGILGGIPGAMIGAAASMLTRPGMAIKQAAAIQGMVKAVDQKTSGAIGRFLKRRNARPLTEGASGTRSGAGLEKDSRKRVRAPWLTEETKERARHAAVPAIVNFAVDGKDELESFRHRSDEIRNITSLGGTIITQRVGSGMEELAYGAPKTYGALAGKAIGAAQFLRAALPAVAADPELSRLGVSPPASEVSRWKAQWEAVANPLSVLDSLEEGRVNPDAIQAVKAVYPRLFERMQQEAITQVLALPIPPPLATRVELDLAFELNGAIEPTVGRESLTARAAVAQEQAQAQARPAPTSSRESQAAKSTQTLSQRIMS